MKNIIFLFLVILLFSCNKEKEIKEQTFSESISVVTKINPFTLTEIKFDYYEFDVGEVEEGTMVEYEFPFENVGLKPLIISNCKSSCGCVVPYCPKEPIPVGGRGIFSAKFDTKGKSRIQHKTLTMTANVNPSPITLKLKATIIPRK